MEPGLNRKTASRCLDQLTCALLDRDGRYLYVSKPWQEWTHCPAEKAIGRRVDEIVSDTHALLALETGQPIQARPVVQDDIPLFTTYIPLRDAKGNVEGLFLYVVFNGVLNAKELIQQAEELRTEVDFYQQELSRERGARYQLDNIIGHSKAITQLKAQIVQASSSASTVLIEGETGSGKELIAHAIHSLSTRRAANFVRVNCSAIPAELMESEFFGYAPGAFTGASKKGKIGRFQLADRGSLFLDEVNLLPATMQPKFLRVLQEREIDPVGGDGVIPVDVRVIAASNIPLEQLVQQGDFRSDLYYRLNVVHITAPPLRNRKEDIPLLVEDIIRRLNNQLGMAIQGVAPGVLELLENYDWPGNVRELQNAIESAMNTTKSFFLQESDFDRLMLRMNARSRRAMTGVSEFNLRNNKQDVERSLIRQALQATGGNHAQAARLLGISRTVLYKKLDLYHMK